MTSTSGRRQSTRTKRALAWVATTRLVLALVALPLAPFLYRHHFLVLVLLRPSQGVLLAGAILARHHHISLVAMLLAAIPLELFVVWVYFLLGEAWFRRALRLGATTPRTLCALAALATIPLGTQAAAAAQVLALVALFSAMLVATARRRPRR